MLVFFPNLFLSSRCISKQVSIELRMSLRRALMRISFSSCSVRPIAWRLLPLWVTDLGVLNSSPMAMSSSLWLFVTVVLNVCLLGPRTFSWRAKPSLTGETAVSLSAENEKERDWHRSKSSRPTSFCRTVNVVLEMVSVVGQQWSLSSLPTVTFHHG
jgi:hypothetical protein